MDKKENKIKVFETFAGMGGGHFALKLIQKLVPSFEYEVVGVSEYDKFAGETYRVNHGDIKNWGDITEVDIDALPDHDILTGGFPCQAFSTAGKREGVLDKRGMLVLYLIEILKRKQPKYFLFENVKGLVNWKLKQDDYEKLTEKEKEFIDSTFGEHDLREKGAFLKWCVDRFEYAGYRVQWDVLNASDFITPQNRGRVWFVGMRYDVEGSFMFPQGNGCELKLGDMLEGSNDEVREHYVKIAADTSMEKVEVKSSGASENANSVGTQAGQVGTSGFVGAKEKHYLPKNYSKDDEVLAVKLCLDDDIYKKVLGLTECGRYTVFETIRKLTPKECMRLMGFHSLMLDAIQIDHQSDTQSYKQAGNGWVVDQPAATALRTAGTVERRGEAVLQHQNAGVNETGMSKRNYKNLFSLTTNEGDEYSTYVLLATANWKEEQCDPVAAVKA